MTASTDRVMSGMRTTHRLHVGNYFGALRNWLKLQDQYQCFFGAMDYHAMTDGYKKPAEVHTYVRDIFAEWIAWGLNSEKNVLFVQSLVPEHIELTLIFANLTPMGWLERVTTWKDAQEELEQKDAKNLGRFTYPVLQTADISIYRGTHVPVGRDQVAHLELSREIVRKFNRLYCGIDIETKLMKLPNADDATRKQIKEGEYRKAHQEGRFFLPEPEALLTETPLVTGIDGRKMSKSYGNTLFLTPEPDELKATTRAMVTDPARVRRTDPGDPAKCQVYSFHKLFSSESDLKWAEEGCRSAGIGCGDCKGRLSENIEKLVQGPRERKKELLNNPQRLDSIIREGCGRARDVAGKTLRDVKSTMGFLGGLS